MHGYADLDGYLELGRESVIFFWFVIIFGSKGSMARVEQSSRLFM